MDPASILTGLQESVKKMRVMQNTGQILSLFTNDFHQELDKMTRAIVTLQLALFNRSSNASQYIANRESICRVSGQTKKDLMNEEGTFSVYSESFLSNRSCYKKDKKNQTDTIIIYPKNDCEIQTEDFDAYSANCFLSIAERNTFVEAAIQCELEVTFLKETKTDTNLSKDKEKEKSGNKIDLLNIEQELELEKNDLRPTEFIIDSNNNIESYSVSDIESVLKEKSQKNEQLLISESGEQLSEVAQLSDKFLKEMAASSENGSSEELEVRSEPSVSTVRALIIERKCKTSESELTEDSSESKNSESHIELVIDLGLRDQEEQQYPGINRYERNNSFSKHWNQRHILSKSEYLYEKKDPKAERGHLSKTSAQQTKGLTVPKSHIFSQSRESEAERGADNFDFSTGK